MILEFKYSVRPPYLLYDVERGNDVDDNSVDLKYWNKQREELQLVHSKTHLIDLWSQYE